MPRPYYAGRLPLEYEQDGYDDRPPEYYGHPRDFSDDYDDPSYYAQPPVPPPPVRRPLPPPPPSRQYYEDEPYDAYHYDGPRGSGPPPPAGLYSRPKRISRERPFPAPTGPPKPLLDNSPLYPPRYHSREPQQQEDFYNDYEPPVGPPTRSHHPIPNNYRPPPLIPPPAVPALNPNIRKAKVTKFGKIVIEGSSNSSKGKAPGEKKHRGVRGGAKARARKAAAANKAAKKLPSLLDPIPGTVRVVGEPSKPAGGANPRPPTNMQGRGKPSAAAGPRPLLPPRSSTLPAPLMGPPSRNPLGQYGNLKSSLQAMYQETKRPIQPVPEAHHSFT